METCKKCLHVAVCGRYAATGGRVRECGNFAKDINVPSWIPVTERPRERGEYLCYYKFEPESPDVVGSNIYYGSGIWMSATDNVTHWMPMPEPPKESNRSCANCANDGLDVPQCKECAGNDFRWFREKV